MYKECQAAELARLRILVQRSEDCSDFESARYIQEELVRLTESDLSSTAAQLGDELYKLGAFTLKTGEFKAAQMHTAKAIGFRRMFFGKGHHKVYEALELAKAIQSELAKIEPRRARQRRMRHLVDTQV